MDTVIYELSLVRHGRNKPGKEGDGKGEPKGGA